jgi:hypothetical protein
MISLEWFHLGSHELAFRFTSIVVLCKIMDLRERGILLINMMFLNSFFQFSMEPINKDGN